MSEQIKTDEKDFNWKHNITGVPTCIIAGIMWVIGFAISVAWLDLHDGYVTARELWGTDAKPSNREFH